MSRRHWTWRGHKVKEFLGTQSLQDRTTFKMTHITGCWNTAAAHTATSRTASRFYAKQARTAPTFVLLCAFILLADHHEHLLGEPHEVCCRHTMGKPKIDSCTKSKARLQDYGLKQAVDALHALMHNQKDTLPALLWLCRSWVVDRADRGDSGNYYFPHLPGSSWRQFAGGRRSVVKMSRR